MRKRATSHSHVAVPYILFSKAYAKSLILLFQGRNGVSGTSTHASTAMKTYITRIKYRVRLELTVGKYQTKSYTGTELFGEKHFGISNLTKTASRGNKTNTADDVCGNTPICNRLTSGSVTLGDCGIVRYRFPAVILYKATKLVRKTRTD